MKKEIKHYFYSVLLAMVVFAITSCEGSEDKGPIEFQVKPLSIDMRGVTGFTVLENNITEGRADESDQFFVEYYTKSTLYSIDANGEISMTVFYFEITSDQEGNQISSVEKEIKNSLQIVPYLMTDLGDYVLFSGCKYQITNPNLSQDAIDFCNNYLMMGKEHGMEFLLRKSDGALFDLTDEANQIKSFTYQIIYSNLNQTSFVSNIDILARMENEDCFCSIAPNSYQTTSTEKLFFLSPQAIINKIENKGNAIDIIQTTQEYTNSNDIHFRVDNNENIYLFDIFNENREYLQLYYSNGSYNTIPIKNRTLFDFQTDDQDNLYLFTTDGIYGQYLPGGRHLYVNRITNGENYNILDAEVNPLIQTYVANNIPTSFDNTNYNAYLGFNNGEFAWLYGEKNHLNHYDLIILTYNIAENSITENSISEKFQALLENNYDIIHIGKTSYLVNVLESSIEVTSYNILDDSITTTTYQTDDIKYIAGRNIKVVDNNGDIYLQIKGRNTANGAKAKFLMHLNTGDNSSNFAKDNRTVSSFIRIN